VRHIIVIGGGSGGTAAAIRAAQMGASVTLIEQAELGGNCTNRACVPLEALQVTARLLGELVTARDHGIQIPGVSFDLTQAMARKDRVVEEVRMGIGGLLTSNGVQVIEGMGWLAGPRTVEVDGHRLEGDAVVIATGFVPVKPPIPGIDQNGVMTPAEALSLTDVPSRLLVIGSEPPQIGLASVFQRFGSRITIVEAQRRLLPGEDDEIRQRMGLAFRDRGIDTMVGATVSSIRPDRGGLVATIVDRRGERELAVDKVLVADRIPHIAGLGLERIGIHVEDGHIAVDEGMRTNVPAVYAVGDAAGGRFSYEATAGGIVAAENALGGDSRLDRDLVPRCIYGQPEAAAVGLTQEEAEECGYDVKTTSMPLALNARAIAMGVSGGVIKIVAEARYGKILGVHIVGPWATELIDQAVLAIRLEALAEDVAEAMAGHPALAESRQEAGRDLLGKALYVPKW
jgi:dihydrolipoamide dehydrogenase